MGVRKERKYWRLWRTSHHEKPGVGRVIGSPKHQGEVVPSRMGKRPLKKKETKNKLGSFARTAQASPLVTSNLRSQHSLSREISLQ